MASTKYLLVSLPTSISPSDDVDGALSAIQKTVTSDVGTVNKFGIPEFKIGTLDALVQQADDLTKLASSCEAVVAKVGDSIRGLLGGDEEKIAQQKAVNDKPPAQYLRSFNWNKVKYRADKPIAELMDSLQKEIVSIDNDVKGKFSQYNQVKTNLSALQKKQTGNLATRSLAPIVDPKSIIQDSEYLETILVAVPKQLTKEFIKSYETLTPMVVPRSAEQVVADDEFVLYGPVVFKKHAAEFAHKCRERKWTPRDYKYVEGGKEEEQKEVDKVARDEQKLFGEALRLGRTAWGEAVMVWVHALTLRVFVETVLRYGLPLSFACGITNTTEKGAKKAKTNLDNAFSYLGGNAFGRDKKGRVKKDDQAMTSDLAAAGVGGGDHGDYSAFVYYEFTIE